MRERDREREKKMKRERKTRLTTATGGGEGKRERETQRLRLYNVKCSSRLLWSLRRCFAKADTLSDEPASIIYRILRAEAHVNMSGCQHVLRTTQIHDEFSVD